MLATMGNPSDRQVGASGIFKAIVVKATRFGRAVTGGDEEPPEDAAALAERVAQAFIAGRIGDVYAMGTPEFRERLPLDRFVARWSDAVKQRGPLTGYDVTSSGEIDLQYIPGLEDVPQQNFVAFLELAFSTPEVPLDAEKAFAIGLVMIRFDGEVRLGAMHAR